VWHNGRPQAMRSYNDDLVIAACITCWVRDTALTANKRESDYKKALLGGISLSTTTLNTKIVGQEGYNSRNNAFNNNQKQMQDYSWIIKG